MACRSTPFVPSTTPKGKPNFSSTGPCSMCNSMYAAAFFFALPASSARSRSMPCAFTASSSLTPSLSLRSRKSLGSKNPLTALEPNNERPKRAPSSSHQSTNRTVTGGLPLYCALIRRSTSRPASTFRQPSNQPPLGTLSRCPPIHNSRSDSPFNVTHKLPASSCSVVTGKPSSLDLKNARAFAHVSVKATRCAPCSSAVSVRSSLSSATVRLGSRVMMVILVRPRYACQSRGLCQMFLRCGGADTADHPFAREHRFSHLS